LTKRETSDGLLVTWEERKFLSCVRSSSLAGTLTLISLEACFFGLFPGEEERESLSEGKRFSLVSHCFYFDTHGGWALVLFWISGFRTKSMKWLRYFLFFV
jgi:hypothetical protein